MTYDEYKKHLEACGPLDDISKGLLSAFELGYGQGVIDGKSLTTKALAQPKWVGLTDDEVNSWELPDRPTVFQFAQFIEAKLKEKNT